MAGGAIADCWLRRRRGGRTGLHLDRLLFARHQLFALRVLDDPVGDQLVRLRSLLAVAGTILLGAVSALITGGGTCVPDDPNSAR